MRPLGFGVSSLGRSVVAFILANHHQRWLIGVGNIDTSQEAERERGSWLGFSKSQGSISWLVA
uniref:Uncharacterized protein n=1 Tax=Cannabis sativa TaxID=3483 RepID=A0A803R6F7_CANSA